MTNQPTPRTWAQQQEYERQAFERARREWMESIAQSGMCQLEAAQYVSVNPSTLYRMAKRLDINLPTKNQIIRAKKEEAQMEEWRKKRKIEPIKKTIAIKKSALMAEGYTEAQALRAIAHQMGVSA